MTKKMVKICNPAHDDKFTCEHCKRQSCFDCRQGKNDSLNIEFNIWYCESCIKYSPKCERCGAYPDEGEMGLGEIPTSEGPLAVCYACRERSARLEFNNR